MSLYSIAHKIQGKIPWLWYFIEQTNSCLFTLRYGSKLQSFSFSEVPEGFQIIPINSVSVDELIAFFEHQPEDAFTFFHPHAFDRKSIKRLQKNRSFLAFILFDNDNSKIAGYFFDRCFFHGQGFRGRMVDIDYRGRGLGTTMNKLLNDIGFSIGLRLFETVSRDNIASYRSAISASDVIVLKEMENNEVFLEIVNR